MARWRTGWLLAVVAGFFLVAGAGCTQAPGRHSGSVPVGRLPSQARHTLDLIRQGGPFPYPDHDGVVFENREGLLPQESSGYYHEYTVPTPGSPDRGARRIVTGQHDEYYYTDDHYRSFRRIEGVT
ncbi:MAG: ribonuclease domain-containing protein [Marmoricola sp.]